MSGEKESLGKLVEKVDELLLVLSKISEDLRSVSSSIKATIGVKGAQLAPHVATTVSGKVAGKNRAVDDVRLAFPEDLEILLSFLEKNDYIMVKPKQFLGSENFAKIASTVRGLGGEYISAGKNSHFRVPKRDLTNTSL
jgi:hypothetical protein